MSRQGKLIVSIISAIAAAAIMALVELKLVGDAQARLVAEMKGAYGSLLSWPATLLSAEPTSAASFRLPSPLVDMGAMGTRQVELVMTRNAASLMLTLTVLAGCLAVAYHAETKWPSIAVGLAGWIAGGAASAALLVNGVKLVGEMSESMSSPLVAMSRPTDGGPPFAVYLVLGLVSAFLWQGLVPWLLGWFAGSRLGAWRRKTADEAAAADRPSAHRALCACGTANLPMAPVCYACGARLADAPVAPGDSAGAEM